MMKLYVMTIFNQCDKNHDYYIIFIVPNLFLCVKFLIEWFI